LPKFRLLSLKRFHISNFPVDISLHPLLLKNGVSFHHYLLTFKLVFHIELFTFPCGLISLCFLLSQGLLPSLASFLSISFHFGHHLFPGQRQFITPNGFSSLGLFSFKSFSPLGFLTLLTFSPLDLFTTLSILPLGLSLGHYLARHFT